MLLILLYPTIWTRTVFWSGQLQDLVRVLGYWQGSIVGLNLSPYAPHGAPSGGQGQRGLAAAMRRPATMQG